MPCLSGPLVTVWLLWAGPLSFSASGNLCQDNPSALVCLSPGQCSTTNWYDYKESNHLTSCWLMSIVHSYFNALWSVWRTKFWPIRYIRLKFQWNLSRCLQVMAVSLQYPLLSEMQPFSFQMNWKIVHCKQYILQKISSIANYILLSYIQGHVWISLRCDRNIY